MSQRMLATEEAPSRGSPDTTWCPGINERMLSLDIQNQVTGNQGEGEVHHAASMSARRTLGIGCRGREEDILPRGAGLRPQSGAALGAASTPDQSLDRLPSVARLHPTLEQSGRIGLSLGRGRNHVFPLPSAVDWAYERGWSLERLLLWCPKLSWRKASTRNWASTAAPMPSLKQ